MDAFRGLVTKEHGNTSPYADRVTAPTLENGGILDIVNCTSGLLENTLDVFVVDIRRTCTPRRLINGEGKGWFV